MTDQMVAKWETFAFTLTFRNILVMVVNNYRIINKVLLVRSRKLRSRSRSLSNLRSRSRSRSLFENRSPISIAIVALRSPIAIILLTVDNIFFISFIGKLVHNHLQKCLFKSFFRNFHSLSSGTFEKFDLQKFDCW